ncbi:Flp pilus assembly protein TadG [Rhodopseudomonas faecalis]|uniref:Flp pilus assembly protein TadG n=2 Tax=Rhodopseudomonas faecalis TaxID=99655 RepID=A0A318TAW6_9BRAD|nr:Flp pilus assembly protein TadG [Rhodopseudomonas faecalis]TAH66976.1 MAG: pilus assembly protein [Rhodopseudomonas palustris]
MSSTTESRAPMTKLLRFRRSDNASAAVEFALIAPMFFGLLFAILETAMVFFAGQALETATQDASRAFLTDQVQSQGTPREDFKQMICNEASALFNCAKLDIDVQSYPPGSPIIMNSPNQGGTYNANNLAYQPPPAGSQNTVVIRVFYQWPIFVTALGYKIANIGGSDGGYFLLTSTVALRPQ